MSKVFWDTEEKYSEKNMKKKCQVWRVERSENTNKKKKKKLVEQKQVFQTYMTLSLTRVWKWKWFIHNSIREMFI